MPARLFDYLPSARSAHSRRRPATARRTPMSPPPPPKVIVAQPVQKPVTSYFELTGNTAPINVVDLVARVQGFLESIDYEDGAAVTKGTQLFGIERDIYQAQLDQAKATLASNQASEAYDQANISASRRSPSRISPARPRSQDWQGRSRPGRRRGPERAGRDRTRQHQPRLHAGCSPRSTASSPIIWSISARWSACRDRPSSRPSSRPTRSTSISP